MLSDIKCDCIFSPNNSFIKQKSMPDEIPTDDDDQYIQIDHTPAFGVINTNNPNCTFRKDNAPGTKFIDPTEDILFGLIAKIKNIVFMKDEEERSPSPADYGKIQRTIAIPAYRQTIEYLLNQLQNKLLERKIVGCISNIYFIILKGREFYYNIMENPELYKQISNMCNRNYFLIVDRLITTHQYYIRK
jgi:hypothetical protein